MVRAACGLAMGAGAFREAIITAIDPQAIANTMLLGALTPIVASVIGVIMAFASREEDGENEQKE